MDKNEQGGAGTPQSNGKNDLNGGNLGVSESLKNVAETAALAAAASAGVPPEVIKKLKMLRSITKKASEDASSLSEKDKNQYPGIFTVLLMFLLLFSGMATIISKGMSSGLSLQQESEFQETKLDGYGMSDAGEQFSEGTQLKEFNDPLPLKNGIVNYVYGTDSTGTTNGFRFVLHEAICKHCKKIINEIDRNQGKIDGKKYNKERSLLSFYENRYPYDLGNVKIGNIIQPVGYGYTPMLAKYDDVNYAEVLTVLGQGNRFKWGDMNYEEFMAELLKEDVYRLLYELGLKWVPIYKGTKTWTDDEGVEHKQVIEKDGDPYDSPEACKSSAPESITVDGVECKWVEYYVQVTVKPFGLRELYAISFETKDPVPFTEQFHPEFDQHKNIDMLAYSEEIDRIYQRNFQMNILNGDGSVMETVDALGPSYSKPRSAESSIYTDLLTNGWLIERGWQGTGRSAWYYIEKTYNDKLERTYSSEDWGGVPKGPDGNDRYELPDYWDIDIGEIDGAKILDMFRYLNQGEFPDIMRGASGESVKNSGCLDCSIAMILMAYLQREIPISEISNNFVNADGSLQTAAVLAAYGGFTQGSNIRDNFASGVKAEIDAGRPTVLHIRGYWQSSNGQVLHGTANGHFLVATGYDKEGIYVSDPGRRANKHISWQDWTTVNDLYYRPIYPPSK